VPARKSANQILIAQPARVQLRWVMKPLARRCCRIFLAIVIACEKNLSRVGLARLLAYPHLE
jgi:hypothetical protein